MVCRNKERAEAAKNEIIDQSKNQARSFTKCPYISLICVQHRCPDATQIAWLLLY